MIKKNNYSKYDENLLEDFKQKSGRFMLQSITGGDLNIRL